VRQILNLDEDLSGFYVLVRSDPDLSWASRGAGRMLRGQTVFEDVVKTNCTSIRTLAATLGLPQAIGLKDRLGMRPGAPGRR
jgi:hypothetical protein